MLKAKKFSRILSLVLALCVLLGVTASAYYDAAFHGADGATNLGLAGSGAVIDFTGTVDGGKAAANELELHTELVGSFTGTVEDYMDIQLYSDGANGYKVRVTPPEGSTAIRSCAVRITVTCGDTVQAAMASHAVTVPGDCNMDGYINAQDTASILRVANDKNAIPEDTALFALYDCDGNGKIEQADAETLLTVINGHEKPIPTITPAIEGSYIQVLPNGGTWSGDNLLFGGALVEFNGNSDTLIPVPTKENAVFDGWTELDHGDVANVVRVLSANWEPDLNGDGIADKFQKKVTFKIANGLWAGGTNADITTYATLIDADGNYSETGTAALVTPADMTPLDGYEGGEWTPAVPASVTGVEPVEYTYTYSPVKNAVPTITLNIMVDPNGGTWRGSDKAQLIKADSVFAPEQPTREGYTFTKWEVVNNTNGADRVFTAQWEQVETDIFEVTENHPAYMVGYPDGSFGPQRDISRAEAATVIYRMLKVEIRDKYAASTNSFTDVPTDYWANKEISTLAKLGILDISGGAFRPDEAITRGELAEMFASSGITGGANYKTTFSDVDDGTRQGRDIMTCAKLGLFLGYPDGTFRSESALTRAEFATGILRVLDRMTQCAEKNVPKNGTRFPDVSVSSWYYVTVIEISTDHVGSYTGGTEDGWTRLLTASTYKD